MGPAALVPTGWMLGAAATETEVSKLIRKVSAENQPKRTSPKSAERGAKAFIVDWIW